MCGGKRVGLHSGNSDGSSDEGGREVEAGETREGCGKGRDNVCCIVDTMMLHRSEQ